MSAQPGNAVLLGYGAQPASAQPGAAVLLDDSASAQAAPLLRHAARAPWSRVSARTAAIRNPMPPAAQYDVARRAPWATGSRLASADFCGWPMATSADTAAAAPWGHFASRLQAAPLARWPAATVADRAAAAPWGRFSQHQPTDCRAPWGLASVADRAACAPWIGYLAQRNLAWLASAPPATQQDAPARSPWGTFNRRLTAGWGIVTPDNNPPTDPAGTIVTPVLRAYIVLNEISLVRVSNSLALPALSLNISADADSWTYSWSASVPASKLDDVIPASPGEPIEFEATINGWPHRLLAEKITLDRGFGKGRVNLSGRGIAAQLAAPYLAAESRYNSIDRNAAQLCDDALLINGVPASGWTIDWNLTDWLVPAAAWSHTGAPMDAIGAIAGAAGGYVRADPTAKTLHIEPRYPVAPWAWSAATPDYELPAAATTKVGIEWVENPAYNAVYVAGTGPGAILGQVKRTGSAGDIVAPMVTDQLITHADAARQRGLAILGAAGSMQKLSLETPVFSDIGIYPVGSLIRFVDGSTTRIGLVRSTAVNAALPAVRQTLEVECHD